MKMIGYVRGIAASVLGLTSLVLPVAAQQPTNIDFSSEAVGAEPKALVFLKAFSLISFRREVCRRYQGSRCSFGISFSA